MAVFGAAVFDGAFVNAVVDRFMELGVSQLGSQLVAVERQPEEAGKARELVFSLRLGRL